MSRIILDTSAYLVLLRGNKELAEAIRESEEVVVNPILIAEAIAGARNSKERSLIEEELAKFRESPRVRIVPINEQTARCYAAIVGTLKLAGTMIPTNDIWIAASAMQYGLTVVTCDAHFRRVPQIICDYFKPVI